VEQSNQSNIAEEKIQLWDSMGDDVQVFVPTLWNTEKAQRAIFVEPRDKDYVISMVFLHRAEAEKYREFRSKSPITFVIIPLGKLFNSFGRFFGKKYGKRFDCVLSTVDIQGEFRAVDVLWSNQTNS
jgi:hypothetical protein